MSFEITYKFYSKLENNEYDKKEIKTDSMKVDSEDLDVLAGKIFSLLARRNIFVSHVEVYETVQKPIFFKENPDGFTLKKRKYTFDDGAKVSGEDNFNSEDNFKDNKTPSKEDGKESSSQEGCKSTICTTENKQQYDITEILKNPQVVNALAALAAANGNAVVQQNQAAPPSSSGTAKNVNQPLRYEFYSPEDEIFVELTKKAYPDSIFTLGKRYPIYSEKIPIVNGNEAGKEAGLLYQTVDDKGKKVSVRSNLFVPVMPKLIGDDEPDALTGKNPNKNLDKDGLYWGGAKNTDMPELRKRK